MSQVAISPKLAQLLSSSQELIRSTKGFMPPDEGTALAVSLFNCSASFGYPAVEIGSYIGLSTLYLGLVAQHQRRVLISVDHHRGSQENQQGWEFHDPILVDPVSKKMDTLYLFRRTIDLAGLNDTVIVVAADSQIYANSFREGIGFLFIDGGHSLEQAEKDYEAWVPKIIPGGCLAIHDVYPDPSLGGQPPFILYQRSLREGFRVVVSQGSLRVMKKDSS
ncbi:MAG: class I SAM-dependent methyltransferase [Acidimicrobiaceae bacterium]|nr:class I SAM-dependent methyltransferase [Acidimicrobiaceae bacterium]